MEFDVVTSESHTWTADVTTNPVETGAVITDHVQLKPDSLEISGSSAILLLNAGVAVFWKRCLIY
ncbi:phage baseplate protein [Pragia fontium]|uniref:phage baseplate protein n=1 Tax=Pragia fontium TaxID=82985 RepID=UPI000E0F590E